MNPRRGVVLVTVLLLLLAATLLVHGTAMLARAHRAGADAGWEASRVRRAALGRLTGVVHAGSAVPTPWTAAGPEVEAGVEVVELSAELQLLAGGGRGRQARWWVGWVTWRGEPATRAAAATAALRSGGAVLSVGPGRVSGVPRAACSAAAAMSAEGSLPPGPLGVGPLALDALAPLADDWTLDRGCDGECTPRLALSAEGGTVESGVHVGVFLAGGDLVLAGSARIRGRLIVDGSLTLRDSARVEGTVDVRESVTIEGASHIAGDRCALAEVWREGVADQLGWVPLESRPWPMWGGPP